MTPPMTPPLEPRLRAGRARILRRCSRRGAASGIAIGLPLATIIGLTDHDPGRALFTAIGVGLLLATVFATRQRRRAATLWPRIWDRINGSQSLIETILDRHEQPAGDPWLDALRARSAHLPLPSATALRRHLPAPDPRPSLALTASALLIGTLLGPFDPIPEVQLNQDSGSTSVAQVSSEQISSEVATDEQLRSRQQRIRGREDAALALAGRPALEPLARQIRGLSPATTAPRSLLPRDLQAVQAALQRLAAGDPIIPEVALWNPPLALDSRSPMSRGPMVAAAALPGDGASLALSTDPGNEAVTRSTALADGGSDRPTDLSPTPFDPQHSAAPIDSIHLAGTATDDASDLRLDTSVVTPPGEESAASWDRVRDDPQLAPRWSRVIDLYQLWIRGKEGSGGR
ncbi:MAG: hypothetical protein OSB12_06180 [Planctomycetota bacterium]|nr:hypothetical protein [Planctomycetota bacterium]